jgi:SAM-dependent methyltransferase
MWSIESHVDDAGAPYDGRAAVYDRLVRSRAYNRLAWSTDPAQYEDFARTAIAAARGPLLEAAAGSAAATARLHATSPRETVLVDLSRPMLERAAQRIAACSGGAGDELPAHVRLVQADIRALPFSTHGFETVLALGLAHLFEDLPALVAALREQLATGGELYLAGLVAETRRARRYLGLLHRAGEVAAPRAADDLYEALGRPVDFRTAGCMAYATLPAP